MNEKVIMKSECISLIDEMCLTHAVFGGHLAALLTTDLA